MAADLFSKTSSTVSVLQMAWLRELGIEKPWLPELAPSQIQTSPQAAVSVQPKLEAPVAAVPSERPQVDPIPRVPAAQEFDSLETLSRAVASCEACGLCKTRERVVVGEGTSQPDLMIIGEAPGEQEDRQGKPFVGKSGKLLDNMLKAIGYDRGAKVYLTNAVKCRPPSNRNPRPEEMSACHGFLSQQIALLRPQKILLLGRFAAAAVLGDDQPLTQWRLKPLVYAANEMAIPVTVTYHPAYLLRRPEDKANAWEDLQQLL